MPQYDRESDIAYKTLTKTDINSNDIFRVTNRATGKKRKLAVETMMPSLATSGVSSEQLYVSITNKNQLNFKGIKSGDTGLLTVATTSNNIVLTVLEAGIDLSLCNNATSGFLTGVDFTGTVTGECGVTNGGTGLSTIAKGAILYADAADSIAAIASSTNGQILVYNSTTGIPAWSTLNAGTNLTLDVSSAGVLKLDATLSTLAADLDCDNNDIDLGTGYLSSDGAQNGVRVTGNNMYLGSSANYHNADQLNLGNGGIRFGNTFAPTIKPTATTSSTAGQALSLESGGSADGTSGNLNLTAGTASGSGTAGSVVITSGKSGSGTDGNIQLKTYTGATATDAVTIAAEGQDVTVNTGSLIITGAAEGIIHSGSASVGQTGSATTAVTSNTTSGIITLYGAVLASAAEVEFTFTNSTIKSDSVILTGLECVASGRTGGANIQVYFHTKTAGSCKIVVVNTDDVATDAADVFKINYLIVNKS